MRLYSKIDTSFLEQSRKYIKIDASIENIQKSIKTVNNIVYK